MSQVDMMMGWGQGKEGAIVAQRVHATQNGDRTVKGHYRSLRSVVNQLLNTLKV